MRKILGFSGQLPMGSNSTAFEVPSAWGRVCGTVEYLFWWLGGEIDHAAQVALDTWCTRCAAKPAAHLESICGQRRY